MTVLPARCVCEGLNRVRNTSLYDLLADLSTRAGGEVQGSENCAYDEASGSSLVSPCCP